MKTRSIALLGLGTVGGGTAKIIAEHQEKIQKILGEKIKIKRALVRDPKEVAQDLQDAIELTTDIQTIVEDPEIEIVVELMGGTTFAYDCIKRALNHQKSVVTANKDLIALHQKELTQLAQSNGVDFLYEASVAGGIPILRALRSSFAGDRLTNIIGILNGTTNFILTKMVDERQDYDEALQEAKRLGFAEADPTADVEGLDAARKVVILAKMAFGVEISLQDITVKGITGITATDTQMAKRLGYVVKLLGWTTMINGKVHAEVYPTLVPDSHPIANVKNEMNAVYTTGEAGGNMMFYGAGAGALPTGTAVVGDIIQVIRNKQVGAEGQPFADFDAPLEQASDEEICSVGYFHFSMRDQPGIFVELAKMFRDANISLDKVFQVRSEQEGYSDVVIVTHTMKYSQRNQIIESCNQNENIHFESYYNVMR